MNYTYSPMIEVQDLVKKYDDSHALRKISFQVQRGEIFAFLGPNGAGKTTTIKILTTLLRATAGRVRIDGLDVASHQHEVRQRLGIVFQDSSLDEQLTVRENMQYHAVLYDIPRKTRELRIQMLATLFGVWEARDKQVRQLSGGMKRRLEVARGLLHNPKALFLDEPTIGLDPQSRNYLWTQIKQLNEDEGVTVFLTTHYMEEAERVAHRIAILDDGSIIAQGTAKDLNAQTKSDTLEDSFIALTGHEIRAEDSGRIDQMRQLSRLARRN
jgi:ABC-2 type transport system ATP-binding protein